ncbi:phosphopantetheine-binding protein [Streptomyces sp. NPDC097619]|uniref:acyl carrier protein n=1 Tax=Streptomyces sp. NPDC097619 TaxID=3157228 RepID=UPI00331F9C45
MSESLDIRVKQILVEVLDLDLDPAEIGDEASLYSTGISLDSLTLLRVITELERSFSCEIDDEAVMTAELFDVGSLIGLVRSQLSAAGVAPVPAAL